MDKFTKIGGIGESYIMHELAKKGIKCNTLNVPADYDLLTEYGTRIEVKTAVFAQVYKRVQRKSGLRTYYRNIWQFANHSLKYVKSDVKGGYILTYAKRDRRCDFFAFVCLDQSYNIVRTYIVPKEAVGTRINVVVGEKEKGQGKNEGLFIKYRDRWDLIKNFI